jgi:glycosyltransferase involved in cell wall biosynthesis
MLLCCPYMGTALIESLLAGCAVVAFDNESHRAIAGDGPVIFVPNGSTIEAVNALKKQLMNPDLLIQYQTKSRSYAWNKRNAEEIAKSYIAPMVDIS